MEEKIQGLTKNLQGLQSTLNTVNEQFQQWVNRPGFSEGGGGSSPSSGGRNPADAAQPEIKETIHSIQTKLDQLDNRTQVSHSFLLWLSVNVHVCSYQTISPFTEERARQNCVYSKVGLDPTLHC